MDRLPAIWRIWLVLLGTIGGSAALAEDIPFYMPPPVPSVRLERLTADWPATPQFHPVANTAAPPVGQPPRPSSDHFYPHPVSLALEDYSPGRPEMGAEFHADPLARSGWYVRLDYFDWNERYEALDFVQESGPLLTLGYGRRAGSERVRVELFGGNVDYVGLVQFPSGDELVPSHTRYFGCRGEYELLLWPEQWPDSDFFLGLGSRLWVRDLPDTVAPSGGLVIGYQETWLTIYPYVGAEFRRWTPGGGQFFASFRGGVVPFTYEYVSLFDVTLYPKWGGLGQVVLGFRGERLSLSGIFEVMTWNQSALVGGVLQPYSRMFQAGLQAGYVF